MRISVAKRMFFDGNKLSLRQTSGVNNFGFFVIVGEKYASLVHRFEKFDRQMKPGLNFIIPIVEKIAYVHDLREQVIEITSQVAVTKDNVSLHIDGVLYI
jgi:regulator of protease activity HflC (stomatin/prohibitin superfamily)